MGSACLNCQEIFDLRGTNLPLRVCFLPQLLRLRTARGFYPDEVDPDPEALSDLDADAKVLVSSKEDRITDSAVARKLDQISYKERIHSLLLPDAIDEAEAKLNIVQVRQRSMILGWPTRRAVVPVNPKKLAGRLRSVGKDTQNLHELGMIELEVFTLGFVALEARGALGVQIPCVDENSRSLHVSLAVKGSRRSP